MPAPNRANDFCRPTKAKPLNLTAKLLAIYLCCVCLWPLNADLRDFMPTTKVYGPQGDFDAIIGIGERGLFGTRVAMGDLNGDKVADLVVAEKDSIRIIFGQATTALVNQTINLQSPSSSPVFQICTIMTPGFLSDIAIDNVIGDFRNELVCSSGSIIYVIPGQNLIPGSSAHPSSFVGSAGTSFGGSGRALCLIDWNTDGRLDIAVGSTQGVTISSITGTTGSGYNVTSLQSFNTGEVEDLASGDVDGNGHFDLVIGCPKNGSSSDFMPNYGQVFVKLNRRLDSSLSFSGLGSYRSCGQRVGCGDCNGDGLSEVLMGSPGGAGRVTFLYGAISISAQSMGSLTTLATGSTVGEAAHISDINADGYGDMIFGQPENNETFNGNIYINYGGPGGARTVSSVSPFDRYGMGDIATGNFYGGEFASLAVGSSSSMASGNSQGATYVTALPVTDSTGSALHVTWTKAGDGPAGEVVPKTRFPLGCTAQIDFSDTDSANGVSAGQPSQDSVTVYRNVTGVTPPRGDSSQLVGRYWHVTSTRTGFAPMRIIVNYPALTGATPDDLRRLLRLYRSTNPAGPWTPLINQSVDTDAQTVEGTAFGVGYFALSVAPNVQSYEFYEDFQSVSAGASLSSLGFLRSNGGSTSGSSHPYWEFATDAYVRGWAGSLSSRWGVQFNNFSSGLGNTSTNVYPIIFWDPASNHSDSLITRGFGLKANVPYELVFNIATPSANVPSNSGSDIIVYLGTVDGNSVNLVSQLYSVSNLKASGLITIRFTVPANASNYCIVFADISNPANSSFYTAIDNIIVRKVSFPTSVAPAVNILTSGIIIRAGETLPGIPLVTVTDVDDDLSRVSLSSGGLPVGVTSQLQAIGGGTLTATLSAPITSPEGAFALTITVWDTYGSTTEFTVPVIITRDDYLRWAFDKFGFAEASSPLPTISQKTSDPDRDGVTNYKEYLFGGMPLANSSWSALMIDNVTINDELRRRLRWSERRPALSTAGYTIQTSSDLLIWKPLPASWGIATRTDAGFEYDMVILVEAAIPVDEPRRFFRIVAN